MFAKTNDEQQLRQAVAADASDRRKLLKLEGELESRRPAWLEIQEQCEMLCAVYSSNDRCYRRDVFEPWWRDRENWLQSEIEKLSKERDAITGSLPAEIAALKGTIHRRQAIVSGDFSSWAVTISHLLPQELAAELTRARTEISGLTDLGEIFARVQGWIVRIGEVDAGPAPVALLNLGGVVRRLAAD